MSNLKEQFVSYNIALELKKLGFNEKCLVYKDTNYHTDMKIAVINNNFNYGVVNAICNPTITAIPLWQQVIDWFDEKDLHIIVSFPQSVSGCIGYISSTENNMILIADAGTIWENRYSFYEQAVLKAIEIVKNEL